MKDRSTLWVYLIYAVMIGVGAYMLVEAAARPFGQWKFPF